MLSINRHPKPGKKTNFSAVSDNQIYFIFFKVLLTSSDLRKEPK